jgi:hypothetical protein
MALRSPCTITSKQAGVASETRRKNMLAFSFITAGPFLKEHKPILMHRVNEIQPSQKSLPYAS